MIKAENPFDSADLVARWRANAERRAAFLQVATERMLDAAGVAAGAHVLDLGTGTGDTAVLAALRVGPEGRVLVRYSGTEAKARVMIEGTDETEIRAHANEIARVMKGSLGG